MSVGGLIKKNDISIDACPIQYGTLELKGALEVVTIYTPEV